MMIPTAIKNQVILTPALTPHSPLAVLEELNHQQTRRKHDDARNTGLSSISSTFHIFFFFLREPCAWKSKLTNLPIMALKSMHVVHGQAGNALWVTAKEVVHHMLNQNYPFFLYIVVKGTKEHQIEHLKSAVGLFHESTRDVEKKTTL